MPVPYNNREKGERRQMKKYLYVVLLSVLVLALAACGTKNDGDGKNASGGNGKEETKIVVGASNTPTQLFLKKYNRY